MGCISSASSPAVIQIKKINNLSSYDPVYGQTSIQRYSFKNSNNLSSTRDKNRRKLNKVEFLNQDENFQITQNVQLSKAEVTSQDKQMLDQILSKSYIFHKLSVGQRKEVIDRFVAYDSVYSGTEKRFSNGAVPSEDKNYLFKKNDVGTLFFVIKKGSVEIQLPQQQKNANQTKKKVLIKGDYFGQIALLYKTNRSASVKCLQKCTFLCLSNYLFKQVLQNIVQKTIQTNRILIQRVKLFQYLPPKQKNRLANNIILLKYDKGNVIFREGQDSYAFYVVVSGKVQIQIKNKALIQLKAGQYFGQSSFQENCKRSGTATCLQKTQLISIDKLSIKKILGNDSKEFYFYSILKWSLKRNIMFNQLSANSLQKILKQSDIINFQNCHQICKKGDKIRKIYIPLQGQINSYSVGQIINCEYLCEMQKDRKRSPINQVTLVKQGQGNVCVMDIGKILSSFNKNCIQIDNIDQKALEELNRENREKKEMSSSQYKLSSMKKVSIQQSIYHNNYESLVNPFYQVKLQNLRMVKKISDGQFGVIYKVRNIVDNKFFALKTFNKKQVDSYKMRHFVKQEVDVMRYIAQQAKFYEREKFVQQKNKLYGQVSVTQTKNQDDQHVTSPSTMVSQEHFFSPTSFIVQYQKHYQQQEYLLILMELIEGKDFFDTMIDIGWLNSELIRFFFASFVIMTQFLHENEIIYRDIKPQNAVVEPNGYLKIIDFGTARKLQQATNFRSFTIIGTPHYMAPQIIAGKGYSFQSDIWSLGILLYQMACGKFPFGQKIQQPLQIYNQIIKPHLNVIYPKQVEDKSLRRLIDRLLIKDPSLRQLENFSQIKQSQFYQHFDWLKFSQKSMKSPFKPAQRHQRLQQTSNSKKNSQQSLYSFLERQRIKTKKDNPTLKFPIWQDF